MANSGRYSDDKLLLYQEPHKNLIADLIPFSVGSMAVVPLEAWCFSMMARSLIDQRWIPVKQLMMASSR